nr:retrovirus-related Pol polyprotein from transposon TNT 1-94 [Tanacetum cinerariifolium]
MLLMQTQKNDVALDKEQLLFLTGGQDKAIDEDMDEQPIQDLDINVVNVFQLDNCDAFDSDVDEAPTAQTMASVLVKFSIKLSVGERPESRAAGMRYWTSRQEDRQTFQEYLHIVSYVLCISIMIDKNEKGQSRLEVVLDLDGGLLQFLQQVFPEQSPSEMVLHQLTSECLHLSVYPDNTVEYVVARM